MSTIQILILAIIQGAAELLPVSSSAHVIVAEKLMGLDPSAPEMTFLLVMLHTGTMFAVLTFFWSRWKRSLQGGRSASRFVKQIVLATTATGVLGYGLKIVIEKVFLHGAPKAEIEVLFSSLPLIGAALFAAGLLILYAGLRDRGGADLLPDGGLNDRSATVIGLVQGLCLPFRGFSRSGATISTAMLAGVGKELAEEFSFALAVVLTPPVILRELMRLIKASHSGEVTQPLTSALFLPGLLGMIFSFGAGLLALRWLSTWIEQGRWKYFGYYCLIFAGVVWSPSLCGKY